MFLYSVFVAVLFTYYDYVIGKLLEKAQGFTDGRMNMELIKYLNSHFLTLRELLDMTKTDEGEFRAYQNQGLMPKASYLLDLKLNCDSFFGVHNESVCLEYYAKGYASWLGIIRSLKTKALIYAAFAERYKKAIEDLKSIGHTSLDPKINADLSEHIAEEWGHFIKGIYGLCTTSGLPEDIAAKEFAIIQINELSEKHHLNTSETERLRHAVNLLDQASSDFAPHEKLKSSRFRLVDEVRRKHRLEK